MEQHNLLLIATAHKFMQLKNVLSKENTTGGCMTWTVTAFNKEHTIIWSRNYNLMERNSNDTFGWRENLKSRQIVQETAVPDVIFWIPHPYFYTPAWKIMQWRSMGCAARTVRPLWGLGGNIIIALLSCGFEVVNVRVFAVVEGLLC